MKAFSLLLSASLFWAASNTPAQSQMPSNDDVAIIIGNKVYEDQDIPEVSFALNDAKAMKQLAQTVLNIREENIIYLENATQAKMQSAFGRSGNHRGKAFQYVKPNVSNLYVFYSGHGVPGRYDDKSYLLPIDADLETADINGYPIDTLYKNLSQVEAKSVTVFLDACFSGQSHAGTLIKRASGAQIVPTTPPIPAQGNLSVLTAASKDQLASWDEESQHGLFTEYLLRALYGEADHNADGQVQLAEVNAYLQDEMRYKARRTYNRDQVPVMIGDDSRVLAKAIDGSFPPRPLIEKEAPVIETEAYPLTPVEENMFAVKSANVRALPTVRAQKVDMLEKGEPIHVAAKVTDRPWYAVEKGGKIVGYVFSDLLGEEKEIATEEENRAIRELKARLEKLEERTRLSDTPTLPAPPKPAQPPHQAPPAQDEPTEQSLGTLDQDDLDQDRDIWATEDRKRKAPLSSDTYPQIETTLKSMGALLARQSFIEQAPDAFGPTRFTYNWIKVDANRCSLSASMSLNHPVSPQKTIDIFDRQIQAHYGQKQHRDRRVLRTRTKDGETKDDVTLYQYGPYSFKDKQDRRQFIGLAQQLYDICPQPSHPLEATSQYRKPPPPKFSKQKEKFKNKFKDGHPRRPPPPFRD